MLAGVEAVLAKLGSIRAANDIRDHRLALVAFVSRPQQLTGFQDELVEGGDVVFGGASKGLPSSPGSPSCFNSSDFLHELEQGRLSFRGFHHSFQRGLVIGELLAGITALDFLSAWMVVFGNTPQPAFATAGFTWAGSSPPHGVFSIASSSALLPQ